MTFSPVPALASRAVVSRFGLAASLLLGASCGDAREDTTAPPEASGHDRMITMLHGIAHCAPRENLYVGDARASGLRKQLTGLASDAPPRKRWKLNTDLGKAELVLGNEREGIRHLLDAYELAPQVRNSIPPQQIYDLTFYLGVACLRLGETQNCCLRNSPDSCILPIRGAGIHTDTEGSERAIGYFTEVVAGTPPDSKMYLGARWLLNIAYMTIGGYPQSVPAAYLIPTPVFESEEDFPRFRNIASSLGIDTFSLSGGAVSDDFDNDGDLDLVVSTWDPSGQLRFHRNNGDGTFTDRTEAAGLTGLYGGLNLVQADYDNDGNVDVLVLRGAWLKQAGRHPNSLLRNNGDGTFTDATFEAGLGEVHYPTQTAAWADYDNDGDLDLYIGNESQPGDGFNGQLFRNDGDGTFTDVAASAGVENGGLAKAVVWGDYDGDRFPDLYVSNLTSANRLYRNNGDGTFVDVAPQLGVTEPRRSFPAWFWDFDNDGHLDLFASAYTAGIAELAGASLDRDIGPDHQPRLYRGDGQGGFRDVSAASNLARPSAPMGSNFGDLDNDGYLDFYLGTGYPGFQHVMPNILYSNRSGKAFADVTIASGFGHLQKGHAVVFADLDNDGDQDVFEQMGGAFPGDRYSDALYENPGFDNHWITVKLVGVDSNHSAIGARIRIDLTEGGQRRVVYRHVNTGGTFGGNPLRQNIGLGRAEAIVALEVEWPTTGRTQRFTDVPLDGFIRIVEGAERYEVKSIRSFRLGPGEPSS